MSNTSILAEAVVTPARQKRNQPDSNTPSPNTEPPTHRRRNSLSDMDDQTGSSTFHQVDISSLLMSTLVNPNFAESVAPALAPALAKALLPLLQESIKDIMSELTAPLKQAIDQQRVHIDDLQKNNASLKDRCDYLEHTVGNLEGQIEELEQYGRRNSLRFHNVPLSGSEVNDTDSTIVGICKNHLKITISEDDIFRSHIIGTPRDNKYQVICRFKNWKIKNSVFRSKRQLKGNAARLFITEDLTRVRQGIMKDLSTAKSSGDVQSYWSSDGRIFIKRGRDDRKILLKSRAHMYDVLPSLRPEDTRDRE